MATETRQLFGKKQIFTDSEEITAANVAEVLKSALRVYTQNQDEVDYLWGHYRGITPIRQKEKESRASINHKIFVDRANEIVTFKRGYGFGEPIQYIRRSQEEGLTDDINRLNEYMFTENKHAEDSPWRNGLRHIHFHDLRHSCASLLLANDVPMKQIQEWLGYSDISTTANIYSHPDYKPKIPSANVMDNILVLPDSKSPGW